MTRASDNPFPSLLITEGTVPTSPAAGKQRLYIDSTTHLVKVVNSGGTASNVGGGGTTVATDTIWDAAGDLVQGTGADTAAKLSIGASGTHLTSNGSTAAWTVPPGTLLAIVKNVTGGSKTTTSSTQADVDATNSLVTFTAPASGNILVRVHCTYNVDTSFNANCFLGLRESTTNIVDKQFAIQSQTVMNQEGTVSIDFYVTGVSAGSHTYKLAFASNSSEPFIIRQSSNQPVIMSVWACA